MTDAKKVKTAISLDENVASELQKIADRYYNGNFSAAVEDAARDRIESAKGPLSKVFAFSAEIRSVLRKLGLKVEYKENAVDWVLPELALGLEAKVKFSPGKSEQSAVAAMAYTVGQSLCREIWIVLTDSIQPEDLKQWDRVASEFHLCPVKVVLSSKLEQSLKQRMGK